MKRFSLFTFCLWAFAFSARAEVLERVVAVVNEKPVFLSEVRVRALPFMKQAFDAPTDDQRRELMERIYSQVLDHMISEMLIEELAAEMQIEISDADVDRAIDNVRQQSNLTENDFWLAVDQQGMERSRYRSDVRRQLLRLKVINQRLRGRVRISEEDIQRRYEQEIEERGQQFRFRLSHLFFPIPEGADEAQAKEILREASAVRNRLTADNFADFFPEYHGQDLEWIDQQDLSKEVSEALFAMEPEDISQPILGRGGYHIFLLQEKERSGSLSYTAMREQLYRALLEETMAKQERILLQQLRREAFVVKRL